MLNFESIFKNLDFKMEKFIAEYNKMKVSVSKDLKSDDYIQIIKDFKIFSDQSNALNREVNAVTYTVDDNITQELDLNQVIEAKNKV